MYNDRFSEVFLSISKHLKSADLPMVDGLIYICTVLRKTFDHYDCIILCNHMIHPTHEHTP